MDEESQKAFDKFCEEVRIFKGVMAHKTLYRMMKHAWIAGEQYAKKEK